MMRSLSSRHPKSIPPVSKGARFSAEATRSFSTAMVNQIVIRAVRRCNRHVSRDAVLSNGAKSCDFHPGAIGRPCPSFGRHRNRRLERGQRSEEHTSELQYLLRTSYAVFCLKNT